MFSVDDKEPINQQETGKWESETNNTNRTLLCRLHSRAAVFMSDWLWPCKKLTVYHLSEYLSVWRVFTFMNDDSSFCCFSNKELSISLFFSYFNTLSVIFPLLCTLTIVSFQDILQYSWNPELTPRRPCTTANEIWKSLRPPPKAQLLKFPCPAPRNSRLRLAPLKTAKNLQTLMMTSERKGEG